MERCLWADFLQISNQPFPEWDAVMAVVILWEGGEDYLDIWRMRFRFDSLHISDSERQSTSPRRLILFQKGEVCGSLLLLVCQPIGTPKPYPGWSPGLLPGSNPDTSAPTNSPRVRGRELKKIVSDHTLLFLGDRRAARTGQCSPWLAPVQMCAWDVCTDDVSLS